MFAELFIKQLLKVVMVLRPQDAPRLLPDSWKMKVMLLPRKKRGKEEGRRGGGEERLG